MAAAVLAVAALAIYPEGHFDKVTKCTTSNFEELVKTTVDSGKTLFAPAWNRITKAFENNTDVAFGDVNLSEDQVRGKFAGSPGGGGWPTIRAYNKQTGYDGVFAGDWKDANNLDGAMCDVFGKDENMQKYVEELGATSLCKVSDGAGCGEKELEFIAKWKDKPASDVPAQLARLQGMTGNSMKAELKQWLGQRIAILKQLAPKEDTAKEEL